MLLQHNRRSAQVFSSAHSSPKRFWEGEFSTALLPAKMGIAMIRIHCVQSFFSVNMTTVFAKQHLINLFYLYVLSVATLMSCDQHTCVFEVMRDAAELKSVRARVRKRMKSSTEEVVLSAHCV